MLQSIQILVMDDGSVAMCVTDSKELKATVLPLMYVAHHVRHSS